MGEGEGRRGTAFEAQVRDFGIEHPEDRDGECVCRGEDDIVLISVISSHQYGSCGMGMARKLTLAPMAVRGHM